MAKALAFIFLLACILAVVFVYDRANSMPVTPSDTAAWTCFKSGETRDGQYKICYYDCLGSTVAITIGAYELCPLTIQH